MRGEVATLIDIGPETADESEIRFKPAQEGERDPIRRIPAVRSAGGPDGKAVRIRWINHGAVFPAGAVSDMQAAVGVDLKVEISSGSFPHEEKLQAAVLMNRGTRRGILRADLLFGSAEADKKTVRTIADLSESPDAEGGQPERMPGLQLRNVIPVRNAGDETDEIADFIHNSIIMHQRNIFVTHCFAMRLT